MTTVLSGPNLKLKVTGARGESFADVARREGSIAGTAVPSDATDQEVLDALGLSALSLTGVSDMYSTHAAATAAVGAIAEGDSVLVLADETHGGKRAVYRKESGALVFKFVANTADDLEAALAAATGADEIGKAGGGTVQDALDDAAAVGTTFNLGTNAPGIRQFGHNFLASNQSASAVGAGTVDQPNVIGGKGHIQTFTGDGSTTAFVVSPGFTVANAAYRNILVYLVERATGAQVLQNESTHYTVSGKGTGTVTITMNSAPTAAQDIFVRVYRQEDSGNPTLLNFSTRGYNNFTGGAGPMTILDGAHHTDIGNPGGHNSALGGSGTIFKDGTSYSASLGLSHVFSGTLAAFAAGMRHYLTGTAPSALGASNKAGSWALALGELTEAEAFYSLGMSRRAKTRIAGDFARGNGQASDAASGMASNHAFTLRRVVTSASTTTLIPVTGTSAFVMDDNSLATVEAAVTLVDVSTGTFRRVKVESAVHRGAGAGTTALVGAKLVTADQMTPLDKSGSLSPSAGTWEAQIVASAGSGGFAIVVRGEAGKTIQAVADVQVTFISQSAAAV